MTTSLQRYLSFVVMTFVIFIGTTLLLWGAISTGPHTYFQLGVTGWLTLHRYGQSWSFDHIAIAPLIIELALAALLSWVLALIIERLTYARRKTMA